MSAIPQYWIVVASQDHAARGQAGGWLQANHGKRSALDRMRGGDGVIIYSPKAVFGGPGGFQSFTALGTVLDDPVYQGWMADDFIPWRRNVAWESEVRDLPLRTVLDRLDFIRNKQAYGFVFRFGVLKIPAADFSLLEKEMLSHERQFDSHPL